MAVTSSVVLPAQPDSGSTKIVPLGGDGYSSPQSQYVVDMDVDMDASGTSVKCTIDGDDRFLQIAVCLQVNNTNTTPTATQFEIKASEGFTFTSNTLPLAGWNSLTNMIYTPLPFFCSGSRGQWTVRTVNTDTFNLRLKALIFNFRIDAAHKIPLTVLTQSLRNTSGFTQ